MKKNIKINENKLRKIIRESIWGSISNLSMREVVEKWNSEYELKEVGEYGDLIKRTMGADGSIRYIYKKRNPTSLRFRSIGICYNPFKNEYSIAISQDANNKTRYLNRGQIFKILEKFFPDFRECQGYAIELINQYGNR